MFETILAEIKLVKSSIESGKYFTAASHAGKATDAAGQLGAKFFEKDESVTTMEVPKSGKNGISDTKLTELDELCGELGELDKESTAKGSGRDLAMNLIDVLVPFVQDMVKKIISGRE